MYIKYKNIDYPCKDCRVTKQSTSYHGLSEDFPTPVDDVVSLCTKPVEVEGFNLPKKDEFVLRKDDPSDYLRQTFSNGVLTLTNIPEPEPIEPIEPEPTDTEVLNTLLGVIE